MVFLYTHDTSNEFCSSRQCLLYSRGQRLKVTGPVLWCLISSDSSSEQLSIPTQHDSTQPTAASRAVSFALLDQNFVL